MNKSGADTSELNGEWLFILNFQGLLTKRVFTRSPTFDPEPAEPQEEPVASSSTTHTTTAQKRAREEVPT